MIYFLINLFNQEQLKQLILRSTAAALVSFAVVMIFAPRFIRFLVRKKVGDRPEFDRVDLNEIMRHKSNTPTMGGLLIVAAILLSTLLFANPANFYVRMAMFAMIWLAALGSVDDWFKLRKAVSNRSRDGLKSWEKILFQIALGMLLAIFIYSHGRLGMYDDFTGRTINAVQHFYLPFKTDPIPLALWGFVVITIITMVGSSNAVNLTDGMDGLAGGCMLIVSCVFLVLAWIAGVKGWANFLHLPFVPDAAELAVVCASMAGACAGFLWYNCNPAQFFMGDTGSLPLGGLIGYIAVVTRQEMILFIAGGVFVMEALSVVMQVFYFKATKGKRIFRCAPIHHHFHLGGWPEPKVVVRFWLLAVLFAAIALASLKLR